MARLKTSMRLAGILVACMTPCAAYYHYVHYLNSTSPYTPVAEKFDLRSLPEKTVTFFVSDTGPTSYTANDSFPSVLSAIRGATQVWNSVATSDLRVAFGGLQIAGTPQSVPTGEVVFEELPPGLLAFAGPAAVADIGTDADGTPFVPILQSLIHLNIDLANQQGSSYSDSFSGPSYSDSFFTTVVHEMGHAIGLQHTFTSATMSTAVTRATTRARPLDADDIAGVSLLYPRGAFPSGFGSITGTVTSGGQGVHLASVVALLPNGSAISTLSNPDGSYEIDGVPPGSYWVYAHPLPPTANIWAPRDANGNALPPSPPFVTSFYPGTRDPSQFSSIAVAAGATVSGINFSVRPRSSVEVYDVTTYGFFGLNPVQPAYLNANGNIPVQTVVANGSGITSGADAAAGLTVQVLGGWGPVEYVAYGDPNTSLAVYLQYPSTPAAGPQHLLFTLPDDIYVLPQAIQIVGAPPPMVSGLTLNADGTVTVAGTGMSAGSQVFFDGLPGTVKAPYAAAASSDAAASNQSGSVSVLPPPGASGQVATITVFNPDGQNSMFLQSQAPYTYAYVQQSTPAAAISIAALPQGASAMVDITTSTMQFAPGLTTLGFGSGDVSVRRLWILSPTHAIANVTVAPTALQRSTVASVISGFQVYEQGLGFHVLPANPSLPIMGLPVPNAYYPLQNSLYPGAIASLYGLNLADATGTPAITVGGENAHILYSSPGQINFVIPSDAALGPAVLSLNNGKIAAHPVVVQIDPPPPVITIAASAAGVALDASQTAAAGDTITLTVTGLDPAVLSNPRRVSVTESGVDIPTFTIVQASDGSNTFQIQFALSAAITGQQVPVTISQDGDLSMPVYINVAAPAVVSNP